jgi:drug/metabolite transporter (DMT)-like permease
MVFAAGLLAAVFLGVGWVLQQRVAKHAALSELLSYRLLLHLMNKPVWWFGIVAMVGGGALGGWALQLGSVTLVEPLLSTNLLFALAFAAALHRTRLKWREAVGAVLLSAALGVFIAVGAPASAKSSSGPDLLNAVLGTGVVLVVVGMLVRAARGRPLRVESLIIATTAGLVYGLQDTATRAGLQAFDHSGMAGLFATPWPYAVVIAGASGIFLSQNAFRAGRLDYSLPPTAAAEPITGIALGVSVLGDRLSVGPGHLAVEALCLVAVIAGVVLIARADSLAHASAHPSPANVG